MITYTDMFLRSTEAGSDDENKMRRRAESLHSLLELKTHARRIRRRHMEHTQAIPDLVVVNHQEGKTSEPEAGLKRRVLDRKSVV